MHFDFLFFSYFEMKCRP